MKPYIFVFLTVISHYIAAQQPVREYSPKDIVLLDLSPEAGVKREREDAQIPGIMKKSKDGVKLSADEQRIWDEFSENEVEQGYWDAVGGGCNWYCGGGPKAVTASSELTSQGENTYEAANAHDLSYKTAWVEGVAGPGIGEYVTYTFAPEAPRITEIIVANGYVKSERAYRDNARVKKLKVYLNDKPFAILNLEDKRSIQHFPFLPIGNSDRVDGKKLAALPPWSLRFEILEVYKGAKYDDTVISEIFFDGIDVH